MYDITLRLKLTLNPIIYINCQKFTRNEIMKQKFLVSYSFCNHPISQHSSNTYIFNSLLLVANCYCGYVNTLLVLIRNNKKICSWNFCDTQKKKTDIYTDGTYRIIRTGDSTEWRQTSAQFSQVFEFFQPFTVCKFKVFGTHAMRAYPSLYCMHFMCTVELSLSP